MYGSETWSYILREKCRLREFENRVLKSIFVPKRDEARGEWRKLHNEDLSDLYASHKIVRLVKSRRMRWEGHVARIEEGEEYTVFWWENLREGIDGSIILRWTFKKRGVEI
jgi:hypothetical protein